MQTIQFFGQIVAAVLFGNTIFGMWFYFFWEAEKFHKQGRELTELPWGTIFCGIFPPMIAMIGIYSIG